MPRRAVTLIALPSLVLAIGLLAAGGPAGAQQKAEIQRKTVLQQDLPIAGYLMVVNSVDIPAGVSEVKHTHTGGLGVYVEVGTMVLEHEGRPATTYKAGEAFYVEAGKVHWAINNSNAPVRLIATQIVEKGKPMSTPAP